MTATALNQIALFDNAAASAARPLAAPSAEGVHADADASFDATGFEIGWDYARQRTCRRPSICWPGIRCVRVGRPGA